MYNAQTVEMVNGIVAEGFEIPLEKLKPNTLLKEDLRLDSLDFVDMLVLLEDKTGIKVDGERLLTIKTVGDIYGLVSELTQKEPMTQQTT